MAKRIRVGSKKNSGMAGADLPVFDYPLTPRDRAIVRAKIKQTHLPPKVKTFLRGLLRSHPELSVLHFNTLIKDWGRIAVDGNLVNRVPLDQYLANFRRKFSGPMKPASPSERRLVETEIAHNPYISARRRELALAEVRAGKNLSAVELHKILHYFTVCSVMDMMLAKGAR